MKLDGENFNHEGTKGTKGEELFAAEEQAPATLLSREAIAEIRGLLGQGVERAEEAIERIRKAVGPQPGKIPQEMMLNINRGAGHLRLCRDTIDRMFKELAVVVRQQTCLHDRGLNHTARRSFCKLCELEFVHDRALNEFVPLRGGR